jgi:hypothetical protein
MGDNDDPAIPVHLQSELNAYKQAGGDKRERPSTDALQMPVTPTYADAQQAPERSLADEVVIMRKELAGEFSYVVSPKNRFLKRWDLATMFALFFTAFITPVEVGFTSEMTWWDALFYVNRLVDIVFISDLFLQFNLAYRDDDKGGQLIKSRTMIAKRYMKGWFIIDISSCVPFGVLLPVPRQMRLLRLLKLLKLARVAKASRLLARYETAISVSYATRDMMKFGFLLVVASHWMACLWGLTDTMVREDATDLDTVTWVTAVASGKEMDAASIHDRYVVALYFTIYTVRPPSTALCVLVASRGGGCSGPRRASEKRPTPPQPPAPPSPPPLRGGAWWV